jgi:hypothetical protein
MAHAPATPAGSQAAASLPAEKNMLTRLMIKDEARVSKTTRDCLERLRAPLAETCFLEDHHQDISESSSPLLGFVLTLMSAGAPCKIV